MRQAKALRLAEALRQTEALGSSTKQVLSRAGIIVAVLASVTTAHAQSTGIAACDDFLTKYDTCVSSKIPAEQRTMYKTQLDQTRKAWTDMSKNAGAKATMEASCKQTMDAMKTSLTAFGCSF